MKKFLHGMVRRTCGRDIGGKENDYLYGGAGSDIYLYNLGDGADHIGDNLDDKNIIRFGAGISSSQITLRLGSLMLDLGPSTGSGQVRDEIHIDNFDRDDVFNSSSIGSFEFADGATRWRARAAIVNSQAANDETADAWRIAA